jgi:hypothetical protein
MLEEIGGVDLGLELDRLDGRPLEAKRLRALWPSPPTPCTW